MITVLALTFIVLAVLGMPLAFALGFAGFVGILYGNFPMIQLSGKMVHSIDSFPLMSIPLFILAGQLMLKGGIMDRLIDLANALVGRVRGGLGQVTVVTAMGLSSVSGTAVADATALGTTLGPSLTKAYGREFSAALVASASNLGPIIPPSAGMILYAILAEDVSLGALFMAGFGPGIFLGLATMALCSYIAYRRGYPLTGEPFSFKNLLLQIRRSFIVFLMPVIVLGGIVGGIFTATEGAAIGVLYALLVGLFVTRRLKLSDLPTCLFNAAIVTGVVGALISFAAQMNYLLTAEMVGADLAEWLKSVTTDPMMFTFLVMVVLILVGIPLEANASFIMLVPILAPIATQYGIDPVYFGLLFVFNITLGGITPPVGGQLFVVTSIWRVKMMALTREIWPFILLQYGVLFVCMLFPDVVLFLPRLLGY
jgi:tripartite ATP-independent transporter DctM subunit